MSLVLLLLLLLLLLILLYRFISDKSIEGKYTVSSALGRPIAHIILIVQETRNFAVVLNNFCYYMLYCIDVRIRLD
jgi:Mn2+/Fe2+ NRAMP family transporter